MDKTITKQTIIDKLNTKGYNVLKTLFEEVFTKIKDDMAITYKTTVLDPFINVSKDHTETKPYNLDNLYAWYLTKNTTFKETGTTIREANPKVPEFKTMLALIIKDLVILLITETFPNADAKDELPDLELEDSELDKCLVPIAKLSGATLSGVKHANNDNINIITLFCELERICKTEYYYLDIIQFIIKYYKLFNYGNLETVSKNQQCEKLLERLDKLADTFYIVYPSFTLINYTKILYFLQAPVLILKIGNIRELTDNMWMPPIFQIWHDIVFHSKITQCLHSDEYDIITNNKTENHQNDAKMFYQNTDNSYYNFEQIFNIIKKYINIDYNLLKVKPELENNKKLLKVKTELETNERVKYFFTFILFYFLHEGKDNFLNNCAILSININNIRALLKGLSDRSIADKIIETIKEETKDDKNELSKFYITPNKTIEASYDFMLNHDIIKTFNEELNELEKSNTQGGYRHKLKLTKHNKQNRKSQNKRKSKSKKNKNVKKV